MPFSEDDLRKALKRQDPGPEFTRRVMERLHERDAESKASVKETGAGFLWLRRMRFAPAVGFAVALVLLIGAWVGYQSYQHHQQEVRSIQQQREMEAKRAEQEAILALRITSEKLNHVFQKVNGAVPPEDKIRRQRL